MVGMGERQGRSESRPNGSLEFETIRVLRGAVKNLYDSIPRLRFPSHSYWSFFRFFPPFSHSFLLLSLRSPSLLSYPRFVSLFFSSRDAIIAVAVISETMLLWYYMLIRGTWVMWNWFCWNRQTYTRTKLEWCKYAKVNDSRVTAALQIRCRKTVHILLKYPMNIEISRKGYLRFTLSSFLT